MLQARDKAWFVRLYGEIIPSFSERIIDCTGTQTMLYPSRSMISCIDLAYYGASGAKDWVFLDYGTRKGL